MISTALTRRDLDTQSCINPACDHTAHDGLQFHASCHPGLPTVAIYSAVTGTITLRCCICDDLICEIAVADTAPTLVI